MERSSENKTILFVLPSLDIGGSESQSISLALMLKNRGWNPVFLLLNNPGVWTRILDENLIVWECFGLNIRKNPLKGLMAFFSSAGFVLRLKPVILYSQLLESNILGFLIVKLFSNQTSHVIGIRGALQLRNPLIRFLFMQATNQARLIILNSNHLATYIPSGSNNTSKVITINNAVHPQDSFVPFSDHVPTFAVLSNFYSYKGHDLLVDALRTVKIKIRIHFIGDGPNLENIKQSISLLPSHIETFFHGHSLNPFLYLLKSHFLVLPSRHEGFPNAVLEGMSVGLPVICFDLPGLDQLVIHDQTGILVDPLDVTSLGLAIEELASNIDLRVFLGRNAHEKSREYSWDTVAGQFSQAFHLVLGKN
jgi:glycosyltransferase involved in cell wall biosynthesis